jgi:hypothetical protein
MCACTGDVADATIASAIGTRGIVGPTNAFAGCASVSSAGATAIASGTGDIARSTGAMRTPTAAPTVPTSASDNDLTEVCGGTIGMRKGTADIVCRTSVPSWSTILLDRRSNLIGGPTMTIPGGTVQPIGDTLDIVGGTGDVGGSTGEAAKSPDAPSSPASSPSAVTKDVMCPQISNTSGPLRSGAHAAGVLCCVEPSGRAAMHAVARAVASLKSSATAHARLNSVHVALAAAQRENATAAAETLI